MPNETTTFDLTLPTAAPAGGVIVTLKSSDPSKVTISATAAIIPEGSTTPAAQPQITGVGIGSATITASAPGYISALRTVTVPPPTMMFAGSPLVIAMESSGNLTLNLSSGTAPAGGLTVMLSSNDPGKVKVPTTVLFSAGASSVTVPVTGVGAGTATITASAPNIVSAAASVTVTLPPTVIASYAPTSCR